MTSTATTEIPARMARLPRNKVGYVVPWFVATVDGQPDFRGIKPGAVEDAVRFSLCWLCGHHVGRYATFVIGPMCSVNRVSAEPPAHGECAEYAAQACPFLANPGMTRRDRGLPEDHKAPAGVMIPRNPGVALCWTSRDWSAFRPGFGNEGLLFDIGAPTATSWWAHGRPATRDEVLASIEAGDPLLRDVAKQEGPAAVVQLDRMLRDALQLIPEA